MEDVVFELVRDLHRTLVERGIEDDANWLYDPDAVWSLELFGRRQLDGEKSLAEQDVLDGSRLWLNKNAKNETYRHLLTTSLNRSLTTRNSFLSGVMKLTPPGTRPHSSGFFRL